MQGRLLILCAIQVKQRWSQRPQPETLNFILKLTPALSLLPPLSQKQSWGEWLIFLEAYKTRIQHCFEREGGALQSAATLKYEAKFLGGGRQELQGSSHVRIGCRQQGASIAAQ